MTQNCNHIWGAHAFGNSISQTQCLTCGMPQFVFTQNEERQKKIDTKLQQIPIRYRGASFDTFSTFDDAGQPCEGRDGALVEAMTYADEFPSNLKNGRCLVLSGETGLGKTHLSFAIFRALAANGFRVERRTISRMFDEIRATYRRQHSDERTTLQVMDSFVVPDLLILDEIGRQRGTEDERGLTDRILDERYEAMRPTLLISNLDKNGIIDYIGDTRWRRIAEGGGSFVKFNWEK